MQRLVSEQSPSRFDRQQHDALAEGRGQKTVSPIEADSIIIDRMRNYPSDTGDFGGREAAPQRIGEQLGSKTHPLELAIDCQSAD
jgi:hypothetical protein